MADGLDDEMRKQLSCSVCLDLYTDPLLLPCLHSLCRSCVQSLRTAGIKECPECKTDIGTNKTELKRNFPLNNLVEIYKQSKTSPVRLQAQQVQTPRVYPDIEFVHRTTQNLGSVEQTTETQQAVIQKAPPRPSLQRQCSTCDLGSTSSADVYCQTCTMSFCAGCLNSLHPKDTDHTFVAVAEVDKIQLCTLCQSTATVRCVECQMTFCQQCLGSYHPTATSSPGHTLVGVKTGGSSYQLTSKPTTAPRPPLPPRQPSLGQSKSSKPTGSQIIAGTSASKAFSSLEIARDVSAATTDRRCALCQSGRAQEASHRCLDCSISICRTCLYDHRQNAPSHTVINIALPQQQGQQQQQQQQQQQPKQQQTQQQQVKPTSSSTPTVNNDIQMKLLELMAMKEGVLAELLEELSKRRVSEA